MRKTRHASCIFLFISRYYGCTVDFLFWYLNNVAFYPGIALLTTIVVQYVSGYGSKIRFFACYGAYLLFPAFAGVLVWPFFVLNMRQGVLNSL